MSAADLCAIADCRIVGFMVHDRAAFGGALFAVGVLYIYLVLFPLCQGEAWAWWLLAISAGAGFGSFLANLTLLTRRHAGTACLLLGAAGTVLGGLALTSPSVMPAGDPT
jgi:hypothetical protein